MTPNEKPIIFTGESPAKILSGAKTQTRRVMKPQPVSDPTFLGGLAFKTRKSSTSILSLRQGCYPDLCPYGKPGDLLWVKEGLKVVDSDEDVKAGLGQFLMYSADDQPRGWTHDEPRTTLYPFRRSVVSPMFMPRWASRLTLEITEIRVQRVQDISEEDAKAEGAAPWDFCAEQRMTSGELGISSPYRGGFAVLWDDINADRGYTWYSNPLVWAISFKRVQTESREPK